MIWTIEWSPRALADLYRIPSWRTAARIDEALLRLAETGQGTLRRVQTDEGPEYRLIVPPSYFVRVTRDRTAKSIVVWRIVRYA